MAKKKKPARRRSEVDLQAETNEDAVVGEESAITCQPDPSDKVVDGLIMGIAPMHTGDCFIFLDADAAPVRPLQGRCILERGHPNYNTIFSLALTAATNRIPFRIRTKAKILPSENARVCYAWVRSF